MTTILGNYLRNLRLENGEILKNMASRLMSLPTVLTCLNYIKISS